MAQINQTISEASFCAEFARQLSRTLHTEVQPQDVTVVGTRGYWSHNYQDVKKFTGHARVGNLVWSFGCWEHTLSALARSGFHLIDRRGDHMADDHFEIGKGRRPDEERDTSDEYYSDIQLEEIAYRERKASAAA